MATQMSAIARGLRNPFRNRVRTTVVVLLLAVVIGLFAVLTQGALLARQQIQSLEANVRTVVELREAGAFGTGGFGGDKPVGADQFSVATLEQVRRIPGDVPTDVEKRHRRALDGRYAARVS